MSTYDNRLDALEQRIADIELERLYEKRKAPETTPAEQVYDIKQVNHRLTMLLGIASGQEHDIRVIKNDVGSIKERLNEHTALLNEHTTLLNGHTALLNEHTTLLNEHTALLNEHTTRFDRVETLLAQILARLPEKP